MFLYVFVLTFLILFIVYVAWSQIISPLYKEKSLFPNFGKTQNLANETIDLKEEVEIQKTENKISKLKEKIKPKQEQK